MFLKLLKLQKILHKRYWNGIHLIFVFRMTASRLLVPIILQGSSFPICRYEDRYQDKITMCQKLPILSISLAVQVADYT